MGRDLGPLEADRAIRLDEHEEHVGVAHEREAGVHRRACAERFRPGARVDHEPHLARVGLCDRCREGDCRLEWIDLGREAREHLLAGEHDDRCRRPRADPAARAGIGQRLADPAERPPEQQIQEDGNQHDPRGRHHDQPERRRAHDHRGDVRHVTHIPVQVDVAAVQRRRRDVGVVADDEQQPDHRQRAQHGG
jgi:hypothetical protein